MPLHAHKVAGANRIAVKIEARRQRLRKIVELGRKNGKLSDRQKQEATKLLEANQKSEEALQSMGLDPGKIIEEVRKTYAGESGKKKKLPRHRAVGAYSLGASVKFWKK